MLSKHDTYSFPDDKYLFWPNYNFNNFSKLDIPKCIIKERWVCKKKRYVIPTSSTWASVLTRSCQLFALPWYARPDHLHSSRTIISNCLFTFFKSPVSSYGHYGPYCRLATVLVAIACTAARDEDVEGTCQCTKQQLLAHGVPPTTSLICHNFYLF